MYKRIRQLPTVLEKYSKQLLSEGVITEHELQVNYGFVSLAGLICAIFSYRVLYWLVVYK